MKKFWEWVLEKHSGIYALLQECTVEGKDEDKVVLMGLMIEYCIENNIQLPEDMIDINQIDIDLKRKIEIGV